MPAPFLGATVERATLREVRHPGDTPPEPRYMPSAATKPHSSATSTTPRPTRSGRPTRQTSSACAAFSSSKGRRTHPAPVTARMVRATRSGSSIMGSCPTPGRIVNDARGHPLAGDLVARRDRNDRVVLQPCDGDRAWQGIQRCDLLIGSDKVVDVDGAVDDVVKKLKALRRSNSIRVASADAKGEPTHSRRLHRERGNGTHGTGETPHRHELSNLVVHLRLRAVSGRPEACRGQRAHGCCAATPGQLDCHPTAQREACNMWSLETKLVQVAFRGVNQIANRGRASRQRRPAAVPSSGRRYTRRVHDVRWTAPWRAPDHRPSQPAGR